MRAVLLLTLGAAFCVALAWFVAGLPGSFTATISGTTIETTTPVALALLAVLFLLIYLVVRLLVGLARLPRTIRRRRAARRRRGGDAAVNRTLVALAANDAGAARREAERSRKLLGDTPLTLLLAAQAGRQAGREADAAAAFQLLAARADGKLLGLRGLLRQAMQAQDWPAAAALAQQAEAAHPGATWLREERRQMALRTGHWMEAMRLSGPADKAVLALGAAEAEADPNAALRLARRAWEAQPGLAPAAVAYARRLRAGKQERQALDVLRRAWAANPHPDVAEEFVAPAATPLARAQEAAQLVRSNPGHAESALLLARAALAAGLPGEARTHWAAAQSAGLAQRRLWQVLADIEVAEGDAAAAQDALRHVAEAAPDPVWRCTTCGTVHAAWHPACDACGSVGTIAWGEPGAMAVPAAARLPAPEAEGLV